MSDQLEAKPGEQFLWNVYGAAPGLKGTATVAIYRPADEDSDGFGDVVMVPTTAGILEVEEGSGSYAISPNAPDDFAQTANNLSDLASAASAWTNLGGGSGGKLSEADLLPTRTSIDIYAPGDAETGTWLNLISSSLLRGGARYNNPAAQNDQVTWNVNLLKGTYKFAMVAHKATTYGIATVLLDGSSVATHDLYAATANNVTFSTTGITVATSGLHTLALKGATKNASSSGYGLIFSSVALVRTGS